MDVVIFAAVFCLLSNVLSLLPLFGQWDAGAGQPRCFYNQMDAVFVRNLQYTKLSQTPLQKIMHLATLRLYAAGGVVRISGINYEEARLLRVQLGKKMEVEHGEHDHD